MILTCEEAPKVVLEVERKRKENRMAATTTTTIGTVIINEEEEEEEEKSGMMMKPWEQHSSVISLPRFDYNAPSSLLLHSLSGFLITCTIKREKSATKEAISILHQFVGPLSTECSNNPQQQQQHDSDSDSDSTSKRRRVCTLPDTTAEEMHRNESPTANPAHGKLSSPAKDGGGGGGVSDLSLVKLTRNGLLLLTFPNNTFLDTVDIVSNILKSLESGRLSLQGWCHRIFPIQATCVLNEKNLHEVVLTLVKKFVDAKPDKLERPLKFAVGFNRRGIEETKSLKENLNGSNSLLDRNKCFATVASAVNQVVEDSVVNLRSPELSVLVELLPLSGVPNGSIVVAVSVLPGNLVSTKPRLCVKALASNTKEG